MTTKKQRKTAEFPSGEADEFGIDIGAWYHTGFCVEKQFTDHQGTLVRLERWAESHAAYPAVTHEPDEPYRYVLAAYPTVKTYVEGLRGFRPGDTFRFEVSEGSTRGGAELSRDGVVAWYEALEQGLIALDELAPYAWDEYMGRLLMARPAA